MALYLDRPNTWLIAGVNLALVLELALQEKVQEEELESLVEESRKLLKLVKLSEVKPETDDDFL